MVKKLLIVHGYSDGSTSFTALADYFIRAGVYRKTDIYFVDYSSMDDEATFRDFADKLNDDYHLICPDFEPVDVACHSTGALVVRGWLALHFVRNRKRGLNRPCPVRHLLMFAPANFGSDDSTTIVTTSSGDTTFSLADSWAITWDTSNEINTSVFYGPNAGVLPTSFTQTVFDCADPDGLGATFDFTVPAGATQRLMFFAGIAEIDGTGDSDTANAAANAQQFNQFETIDSSLTSDLTPSQLASVLNWSPATAGPATSIPTLSNWALVLLGALMLGLASVVILRR